MEITKFTVVIPTRERSDTLLYCLRTVVAQDYKNLQIIVSDNFSQDNTKEVVLSFSDPRIKYINTGKRLGMTNNWEFALRHVTDGWVTFIGDDDGLLPGALATIASVIKKTGCQAITSRLCSYGWPESCIQEDRLIVPTSSGIEHRKGREWLRKLMRGDAECIDLPRLYTGGFVDIMVIKDARGPEGTFFMSQIPDFYSAIALACRLDDYILLKEPVAVSGLSRHSTGASCLGISGRSEPSQMYFSEENIPFHSLLNNKEISISLEIAVYESYLQSYHLHHDFLKVALEDQLSLALAGITQQNHADLRKYCNQIAHDNNIDMDIVDKKVKVYRLRLFIQQLKKLCFYSFQRMVISTGKYGVVDIYGASLLAKAIFLLETSYVNRKFDNFLQLIKGGLKRWRFGI